ncbi:primosomal protein N' [Thalassotalea sp. G2M2-11]|uniref:primosomal protein N' n=1 Tax=Thalassotalea sp. G2M2-11 TaxID=2787627 RepID=UPI0019CFB267|nr:primosomal protein N' [Thalassotalea sp. G2M2-11]
MPQAKFLQLAIPVPLRQLFTYAIPDALLEHSFTVGERVVAPFGHRHVIGIVMAIVDECEFAPNKIKAITNIIEHDQCIPQALIKLLTTCASYYHHPIGDVFHQALPVLLRQVEPPSIAPIIAWQCLPKTEDNAEVLSKLDNKRSKKQWQLYQLLSHHQQLTWPEIRTLGFNKAQLSALENKQLIASVEQLATPFQWHDDALNQENEFTLSTEQAVVVSAISQSIGQYSCHLIDGITGSGKTEVYLQSMTKVLSHHQQVLVLVPEIGLTPQTLSRFEQRFNVPIFLHHSGLNDKERLATWQNANQNNAAIIIGTRSAVFSPLPKLGLIIVDEEHDASFKQQDSFRYHGRDVAIIRAKQLNIPIILGSATPSFESLHNAIKQRYHYHQLTKRAAGSRQAKVSLLDVSNQTLQAGLSLPLKKAISQTLERGEQVLIFLNRRGYSPAINCQECHWVAECTRCQCPYTLHRGQGLLICHHCGSQKRVPAQCDSCGSVRIKPIGQGTEQIEEYLAQTFAQYSTVRIDRDSTRRKGELNKLLQQVLNKEHQILIGTQMLAKGHHFPDVTLVAMLDIDGALFSFDYRAPENMAQLIVQVAGRAGRASKPGKVLVQTQYPQHPLLQDLVNNGYQHFAKQGLNERQMAFLPPFGYQALVRADANYPSYPEKFLRQIATVNFSDCELAGPMPAAIEKRAGKYRFHLLLQAKTRQALHQGVTQVLQSLTNNEWQSKVRWSIDIDPIELSW